MVEISISIDTISYPKLGLQAEHAKFVGITSTSTTVAVAVLVAGPATWAISWMVLTHVRGNVILTVVSTSLVTRVVCVTETTTVEAESVFYNRVSVLKVNKFDFAFKTYCLKYGRSGSRGSWVTDNARASRTNPRLSKRL